MTEEEARNRVAQLAPTAPAFAIEWGVRMMLIIYRACGHQSGVSLDAAWEKSLEVSVKAEASLLLSAMASVPPKPELLPAGWE